MTIPKNLKPGDKIGVVAPARKINPADLEFAVNVMSLWGLEVVLSKNIYSSDHSYLSGTDEERLSDIQTMINDPDIHAIISARGGYGSTRILDAIDFSPLKQNPKWIIGFSDITAIHLKLLKHQIASIHGTMPILFSNSASKLSVESLKALLFSGEYRIDALPSSSNVRGQFTGIVTGGNLSLIVDSLGTATEPDTTNKILVLEEIDEYLYKIDRMMTQLHRAGKLSNLRGLIIGHMTNLKDSDLKFGEGVEAIVLNAVKDYSYPIAFNFPSGHDHPNYAWIHGAEAMFSVSDIHVSLEHRKS
jgi:muramoyltetrapeptide carboxypeptidase